MLRGIDAMESVQGSARLKESAAQAARESLKVSGAWFVSKTLKRVMQLRACSLAYRSGTLYPLREPDASLKAELIKKASAWKSKMRRSPTLTPEEERQIETFSCYQKYASALVKDPVQLEKFFKWALLNGLDVNIYVQFPKTAEKIYRSLHKGLGAFGGKHLHFEQGVEKKDITMDIEGRRISILNPSAKILLSHGLTMSVQEILDHYGNKNYDEGFLCFFEEGLCNWDSNAQSPVGPDRKPVKPLDLEKERWWEGLRMKAHYSVEEAVKTFKLPLDGKNYGISMVAKRRTPKLNTFGSHAFFRILIPDGKGGYDYTFGWGKLAARYPQNILDTAKNYLGAPQLAIMQNPDCNEANPDREEKAVHFVMSEAKGAACLDYIKSLILLSRKGLLVFQILVHNCTDLDHYIAKHFIDDPKARDLFKMPLNHLEVAPPFGWIMTVSRKLPYKVNQLFFKLIAILIGGHRKLYTLKKGRLKEISLKAKPPFERFFQHPGMLWRTA